MNLLSIFLQTQPQGGGGMMMIMMGVMVVGFYFLMIRPQMRKQKQEKTSRKLLKWGQEWFLLPDFTEELLRFRRMVSLLKHYQES